MASELIYTSSPNGIFPGVSGYCTIVASDNLSRGQCNALERLSVFDIVDPEFGIKSSNVTCEQQKFENLNPAAYSHLIYQDNLEPKHVLIKTSVPGTDYTERPRKFSHILIFDPEDKKSLGPAAVFSQPQLFRNDWSEAPRILKSRPTIEDKVVTPAICHYWAEVCGDPGWAGWLASKVFFDPQTPYYLVVGEEIDCLKLMHEAVAVVEPSKRWQVTFSTNYHALPPGIGCQVRFVRRDAAEFRRISRLANVQCVDISNLGECPESEFAEAARRGCFPDKMPSISGQSEVSNNGPTIVRRPVVENYIKPGQRRFLATIYAVACLVMIGIPAAVYLLIGSSERHRAVSRSSIAQANHQPSEPESHSALMSNAGEIDSAQQETVEEDAEQSKLAANDEIHAEPSELGANNNKIFEFGNSLFREAIARYIAFMRSRNFEQIKAEFEQGVEFLVKDGAYLAPREPGPNDDEVVVFGNRPFKEAIVRHIDWVRTIDFKQLKVEFEQGVEFLRDIVVALAECYLMLSDLLELEVNTP